MERHRSGAVGTVKERDYCQGVKMWTVEWDGIQSTVGEGGPFPVYCSLGCGGMPEYVEEVK